MCPDYCPLLFVCVFWAVSVIGPLPVEAAQELNLIIVVIKHAVFSLLEILSTV
jgi:hypothetical protein